jgi:hypothetical protein
MNAEGGPAKDGTANMVIESARYENTGGNSIAMSMDNRYDANPSGGDAREIA